MAPPVWGSDSNSQAPPLPARPSTSTPPQPTVPPKPSRSVKETSTPISVPPRPKPIVAPPIPPRPNEKKLMHRSSLQTLFSNPQSLPNIIRPVSASLAELSLSDSTSNELTKSASNSSQRNSGISLYKLFSPTKQLNSSANRPMSPPLSVTSSSSTPHLANTKFDNFLNSPAHSPVSPNPAPVARKRPPKYKVPPEFEARYALRDELGIGGYGYIFSAIRRKDSREVAVKLLPREHVAVNRWTVDPGLGLVPMELWVMKNVVHPGIVQFYDLYQTPEILLIIMELFGNSWKNLPYGSSTASVPQPADKFLSANQAPTCNTDDAIPIAGAIPLRRRSTDLFELLEVTPLTEQEARTIFIQVVDTLEHLLNYHGLIHGDIKDENVLVARLPDGEMKVKLIDFGATIRVKAGKYLHTHRSDDVDVDLLNPAADCSCGKRLSGQNFAGTLEFAAPEILKGEAFYDGERAQIWSIGVLLYDMLFRCMPFADVQAAIHQPFARNPTVTVSDRCLDLLDQILQKDPAQRLALEHIMQHPWYVEGLKSMAVA
ncbi:hypothetical protein HK096_002672 [Nowakowskiella sp. JEL0078]|nr:hypothetical protein HK096_002672 [Nowakowskiella sp. JEL0078]